MSSIDLTGVLVAALGGAAVGLERQWSGHAEGPAARFAGLRTFTLLGALGGLGGALWTMGATILAAILLAGGVALTVAAYVAGSRHDVDGTTEAATLIVLTAGVLAGLGLLAAASAIVAVTLLLLIEKSQLHAAVRRIDSSEMRAGVRFAVMALVVLPLLPAGPFGPFGAVRPRELWMLVLFFSGLGFLGHVLHRLAGPRHGYLLSGLLGGLVSSTNATFTFARASREHPSLATALATGAVGANLMLYPRVITATAVLNASLVPALLPYLLPPAAVAGLAAVVGGRRQARDGVAPPPPARNPLQLAAALQMAAIFQVVLLVVNLAGSVWGRTGVLTTAALLGLTDVDALTMSMARDVATGLSRETAALAVAIGILVNTAMKLSLSLVFGGPHFRRTAGAVLLLMAAAALAPVALAF